MHHHNNQQSQKIFGQPGYTGAPNQQVGFNGRNVAGRTQFGHSPGGSGNHLQKKGIH
jgi:hypothetical protein